MDEKKLIEERKSIVRKLSYSRLKAGMTQQQLADAMGTKKSNISRLESGNQNISLDTILKLADALDLKAGLLMEEPKTTLYADNEEYSLRLFDDELVRFKLIKNTALEADILFVDESKKPLFPVDLELTSEGMIHWLRHRLIPSNRAFVASILKSLGLNLGDLKGVIDVCKGLSLNDSYWVVPSYFEGKFADYNLYENPFSEILSLVAYTGAPYEDKHFKSSPEFTTNGMLRKAWRIKKDGVWLYKGGTEDFANAGNEPYSEYYACQIAEKMGLNAVHYELENWKGILASKCRIFTSLYSSYVPIGRIVKTGGINACLEFYKELGESYYEDLCSMLVFDAVIYNEDRHFGNFGLLRNNKTGDFMMTAPIFDNGNGLFCYAMKDDFRDLDAYAKSRSNPYDMTFEDVCRRTLGKKQKSQLRKLIGFRFTESDISNLPTWRLRAIEDMVQKRVQTLLEMPDRG